MRLIKCIVVFCLSLLLGACPWLEGELDIDIGDYDNQLEAWNNQNMLEYKTDVSHWYSPGTGWSAHNIIIKDSIPESNNCSRYWLEGRMKSTIPEFFSLIKSEEKSMEDEYSSGGNRSLSLKVSYNTEYHYPKKIISERNGHTTEWIISLKPLEEGELDIDIGDYEYHWEAWNSQNMLDYQISMKRDYKNHTFAQEDSIFVSNVKNGISLSFDHPNFRNGRTIPEIYAFIKEEEESIRNAYNEINRPYLRVQYHPVYHYPMLISSGVDFFNCRLYEHLEIIIIPGKTQ